MLPNFHFMLLIDIDPISKIFKILFNGTSGFSTIVKTSDF